jgi:hypothetical protein
MRNVLIATLAAALAASAVPAAAAAAAQGSAPRARTDTATEQPVNSEDPERRICVAVELTGSRMVRRVCRTQREWDARGGLESDR